MIESGRGLHQVRGGPLHEMRPNEPWYTAEGVEHWLQLRIGVMARSAMNAAVDIEDVDDAPVAKVRHCRARESGDEFLRVWSGCKKP